MYCADSCHGTQKIRSNAPSQVQFNDFDYDQLCDIFYTMLTDTEWTADAQVRGYYWHDGRTMLHH